MPPNSGDLRRCGLSSEYTYEIILYLALKDLLVSFLVLNFFSLLNTDLNFWFLIRHYRPFSCILLLNSCEQ
jgi:hypothetical protein